MHRPQPFIYTVLGTSEKALLEQHRTVMDEVTGDIERGGTLIFLILERLCVAKKASSAVALAP